MELPFDPVTGVLRAEVWQRWRGTQSGWFRSTLWRRSMQAIWIDAGAKDQWFLDIGVAAFRAALRDPGVADEVIHFELFDAPHMGIDYRYPLSLRWLCQRISP